MPPESAHPKWSIGDKLLNPARPDWGVGIVTSVAPHVAQGKQGQRLGIRFDGAGLKTVSTVIINLQPASAPDSKAPNSDPIADLTALPPNVQDQRAPQSQRLTDALTWYRFREGDRAAMDWAILRLGVADPLSQLSREQLHEAREGFFRRLDHHVRELARDVSKKDPAAFNEILQGASPPVRAFLVPDNRR